MSPWWLAGLELLVARCIALRKNHPPPIAEERNLFQIVAWATRYRIGNCPLRPCRDTGPMNRRDRW